MGLIDEYRILVHPVVGDVGKCGRGRPSLSHDQALVLLGDLRAMAVVPGMRPGMIAPHRRQAVLVSEGGVADDGLELLRVVVTMGAGGVGQWNVDLIHALLVMEAVN